MDGQGTPVEGSFPPLDRTFLPRGFTPASSLVDSLRATATNLDDRQSAGSGRGASGSASIMSPNSKAIAHAEQALKNSKSKGRMLQLQQDLLSSEAENARLSEGVFCSG